MGAAARSPISRCCSSTSPRSPASSASATPPAIRTNSPSASSTRTRKIAAARRPRAPAGAARQRPHPRGDEARLHGARVQEHGPQAARGAAGHLRSRATSSSAFPARPTPTSRGRMTLDRRRRLRPQLQLRLQPAARHAGRRAAPTTTPADVKLGAPAARCRPRSRRTATRSAPRASARCSASWSRAARGKRRERADGPHRVQPRRQLRRRRHDSSAARRRARSPSVRGHSLRGDARSTSQDAGQRPGQRRTKAEPPQATRGRQRPWPHRWRCGRRGRSRTRPPISADAATSDGDGAEPPPGNTRNLAPPQQLRERGRDERRVPTAGAKKLTEVPEASSGSRAAPT